MSEAKPSLRSVWRNYVHSRPDNNVLITSNPETVTFTHPGFPCWIADAHSGKPNLNMLMRIVWDCYDFGSHQQLPGKTNLGSKVAASPYLFFQSGLELKMSRAMYNTSVPKWPVKVRFRRVNRTGPFTTNEISVASYEGEEHLVSYHAGGAFVDKSTRRLAKTLPEWLMRDYDEKYNIWPQGLKIERLNKRPLETYKRKMMVLFTDLDAYKHANYLTYFVKCLDVLNHAITEKENPCSVTATASPAHLSGSDNRTRDERRSATEGHDAECNVYPKWLTSAVMKQGVKTVRGRFIKESLLGEEVSVHVWQEENEPFWVFVSMERESPREEVIFELALEFFSPASSL